MTSCPLCLAGPPFQPVQGADQRHYHHCPHCALIFADPAHHLSRADEQAYYTRTHHNSIEQAGYVGFLNRLLTPMLAYLHPPMRGLDYGCGPGPTLSELVRRQGLACTDYDPIFPCDPLEPPYDFILSTECFEHFYQPHQELTQICHWLKPGGLLGVMTEQWTTLEAFARWYYTKDPTHIVFYHADSLRYLHAQFGLKLLWQDQRRVFIFQRS